MDAEEIQRRKQWNAGIQLMREMGIPEEEIPGPEHPGHPDHQEETGSDDVS